MVDFSKKPSLILSLFSFKCPNCRRGKVFKNRSVFPLGKMLVLSERCNVCKQKMMYEQNNGGGINYALTMIAFFLNLLWYVPIFGLSYKDNSYYYFMLTSVGVILVLQPWLMRLSRVLYLYLYIHYGKGAIEENSTDIQ